MIEHGELDKIHNEWLRELFNKNIILDLGGGKPYQGAIKKENLSKGSKYYCMDYCAEYMPNIVGDVQVLPFKDESIDGIYCGAVLEHVPEPWQAIKEINRILKKDGLLLTYVPFAYPYHGCREYNDYYRFSIDAVQYLLKNFSQIKVITAGGYINATLRYVAGFTTAQRYLLKFERFLSAFLNKFFEGAKKEYKNHFEGLAKTTTGYYIYAKK